MSHVFIAPKIRVGFQERSDTFTGQLAYIIYYDVTGKIRKEKSWESWRDKKIPAQEFDNTPVEGFTINRDVKRYSGGWFSSTRTMVRIHDPRGFEFEVTTENLIGILMHTDCLRRGLIGQFVYAWCGTDLVLLPTNSEEYQEAAKYTTKLGSKVSVKELIPGASYATKREGDVIYLGKFNWYEYSRGGGRYSSHIGERKCIPSHVFTSDNGKTFIRKSSVEFLALANSTQPVSNYAELVNNFNKWSYANKIVKFEMRPAKFDPATNNRKHCDTPQLCRRSYFVRIRESDIYYQTNIDAQFDRKWDNTAGKYLTPVFRGYTLTNTNYDRVRIKMPTGELSCDGSESYKSYTHYNECRSLEYVKGLELFDLFVTYENGEEKQVYSLHNLT